MKLKKVKTDYVTVLKYLILFLLSIILNNLSDKKLPYSTAIFITAIGFNYSLIASSLLYLLSFIVLGKFGYLAFGGIVCLFFIVLSLIYKKFKTTPKYELVAYTAVSMIAFIMLGDTNNYIPLSDRIFATLFTTVLVFLCTLSFGAISEKGLKFKFCYEEIASLSLITVLFGLGICNAFSPYVWKSFAVFTTLLISCIYKKGRANLISSLFGISLAVYYGNINYVSAFLLLGITADGFMDLSRYISAIMTVTADYLIEYLFGIYNGYLLPDFLSTLLGALAFTVIPYKILKNLKDKLYLFREKQLSRASINRNRIMLSNKLYDLSGVFTEMSEAFNSFTKKCIDEEVVKDKIKEEIRLSVCQNCDNYAKCKTKLKDINTALDKMTNIGFAKGKLSLIDMPKELGEKCIRPSAVLYGLNKLLADYRSYLIDNQNFASGRQIIAREAQGVSEILRGLALEESTLLKYQSRTERILSDNLYKEGFAVSELLIYGEEENLSIGIILSMKEFQLDKLLSVIKKTVGKDMELEDKNNITEDKCYLSFRRSVEYDAIFGIAGVNKDSSPISGDTHSVTRISFNKFLVALSDGMGSGDRANEISSISLSLIESFYKAGMNSELILSTVNKLMSINSEEDFTALDISVIDLKTCTADFIKYGAPYGFIVGTNGIRIVEGNSLPLGILEELKPSVCETVLNPNDIVVVFTDGVSDAFSSSSEMIDFLRTLPAKNPQTMANQILEKAIELNKGEKKDDMTVLCVRVYKKTA